MTERFIKDYAERESYYTQRVTFGDDGAVCVLVGYTIDDDAYVIYAVQQRNGKGSPSASLLWFDASGLDATDTNVGTP